jgi:hypothetical protein
LRNGWDDIVILSEEQSDESKDPRLLVSLVILAQPESPYLFLIGQIGVNRC